MAKKKKKFPEPNQQIQHALLFESARGSVLAGHGQLDVMLETLLHAEFSRRSAGAEDSIQWLFEATLQSFHVKNVMAYILNLIDHKTFTALQKLKDLRNHFAHHPGEVRLTYERVNAVFEQLDDVSKLEIDEADNRNISSPESAPQMRFAQVALALMRILEASTIAINGNDKQENKR